jgi:hypothetical protein
MNPIHIPSSYLSSMGMLIILAFVIDFEVSQLGELAVFIPGFPHRLHIQISISEG